MQEPNPAYGISQDGVSEDCLYLNVYRPNPSAGKGGKLPVLVWVHGGSFVSGSASAPGLDGGWLSSQYGVVVVTVQYRLGMFGFLSGDGLMDHVSKRGESAQVRYTGINTTQGQQNPQPGQDAKGLYNRINNPQGMRETNPKPSIFPRYNRINTTQGSQKRSDPTINISGNQGLQDLILALQFLQSNIASFSCNPSSITLAGQSSGAHLIRSLLNSPSATSLFHKAILHSDPANFGTQTLTTSNLVSSYALSQTSCSDLTCLRNMSAGEVLSASTASVQAGPGIDVSVASAEVWRPYIGELTGAAFEEDPGKNEIGGKPIIFTNVENEGGSVVGNMLLPSGVGAESAQLRAYPVTLSREQLLEQMFNGNRAPTLNSAPQYAMNSTTSAYPQPAQVQIFSNASDGFRRNLETILTQGMFTCPTWNNALRYAAKAPVYVGLFEKGITYPSNQGNDYCAGGRVCHEDDIQLVFSDPNKVDGQKKAVVKEVQARWVNFMRNGNPNGGGYGGWNSVGTNKGTAQVLRLGVDGGKGKGSMLDTISLQTGQYAGCGQVWGSQVKYDWQLYG